MSISTKIRVLMAVLLLSLLLSACGGGDGEQATSDGIGILVDSPISGVAYACTPSGKSGFTGSGGEYDFSSGDTVTFSIGDIVFPVVSASSVVTVLDLANADLTTDQAVVNIAVLLQSLDDDGDISDTITITEATTNALTGLADPEIDFNSTSFASELTEVVNVTGISLVSENDAIAHLTNELAELTNIGDTATLTEIAITVDGSASDWAGVVPIALDPQGDQAGNSSTDLVSFSAVMDGENMVLLLETSGPITMPHTPSQNYSHYEIGIHSHSDSNCGNEIGYIIANNFTDSGGMNYHQLDSYITGVPSAVTTVAFQTNYLETSFNASQFLAGATSISFNPYIQSFGTNNISHDSLSSEYRDKCYVVNSSGTGGVVAIAANIVSFSLTPNDSVEFDINYTSTFLPQLLGGNSLVAHFNDGSNEALVCSGHHYNSVINEHVLHCGLPSSGADIYFGMTSSDTNVISFTHGLGSTRWNPIAPGTTQITGTLLFVDSPPTFTVNATITSIL